MSAAYAVVTAIGADRVGIVDDLSAAVLEARCNIEESKMAVLGGDFAVIMLVSGEETALGSLARACPSLGERLGLRVECRSTGAPARAAGRPYLLSAVSLDTPGIVHSLTTLLRRHRINIEDLETDTAAAPWTGAPMFRMRAHVVIAPGVSIDELRAGLARLGREGDLDVTLAPVFPTAERE
jgi:glycine cleavage system transcriptional repressor